MTRNEAIYQLEAFMGDMQMPSYEAVSMAKDALEEDVVKCKECGYMKEVGGHANCDGYLLCRKWHLAVDAEDYCSWGKEKP